MTRRFWLNLLFALALMMGSVTAYAETAQTQTMVKDIVDNPDSTTLIFKITWETGDMGVTLIAPSGRRIPMDSADTDVVITKNDKYLEFKVYKPDTGLWQGEFTGGGNGKVKVEYTKLIEALKVQNLKVSPVPNANQIDVAFSATGDAQSGWYRYEVFLIVDSKDVDGKLLADGSGSFGSEVKLNLSLDSINSYSNYYVRVNAYSEAGEISDFDSVVSQPFSFINHNDLPEVTDLEVMINTGDQTLALNWKAPESTDFQTFKVYIYSDDETTPFVMDDVPAGETSYFALYPETAKNLRVEVMTQYGNITGKAAIKEVNVEKALDEAITLTIPENLVIGENRLVIPYKVKRPATLAIDINGNRQSFGVEKDGSITLDLDEDRNQVVFIISENGINTAHPYEFIVDSTAPQLSVYEDIDGLKVVDASIAVIGNVEQSAMLFLNGKQAEFDANGDFILQYDLKYGKNTVTVTAKDYAGNVSEYRATVRRAINLNNNFYILIAGLVLATIILVIYLIRGVKKK